LTEDARREVPPFGAESIRMARELGPAAIEVVKPRVLAQDDTALLALEALRAASREAYDLLPSELRARTYASALARNAFYNTWGLPGFQLSDTAEALIALGKDALPALRPLLRDQREAPLSGSKDATTSRMYANRVCDYAWVLISEILGRPYEYALDPAARDQSIASLLREPM
jgi:hypothetical protein